MKKILVIEDSSTVRNILLQVIQKTLNIPTDSAKSMAECRALIKNNGSKAYFAAMVDLNLPDAAPGEAVAYTLAHQLPSIVLTGDYNETMREKLLNMGVVDYVIKDSTYSFNYAISLLQRLHKNQFIKLLVVEDSKVSRSYLEGLLKQHLFQVYTANDGVAALSMLEQEPDIKILLTDYNMPNMDGFQLVQALRQRFDKNQLAIIGLSSANEPSLSARFIKHGANDFLSKPFIHEELYCRVNQTLDHIELVAEIQATANRDFMTKLYNRRYLFIQGAQLHARAKQGQYSLAVTCMDIDHFKEVNDTYGHEVGDIALKHVANMLTICFPESVVARLGGEEFCILMTDTDNELASSRLNKFREKLAQSPIVANEQDVWITASFGVSNFIGDSLDSQLNRADKLLYEAKNDGRNRVYNDTDADF
ncbi:diguanylate cyclase [Motilimonas sp. 1_MG-2023]|uniref:diguanylate cyclase n=1 Tax=Motilimonas sp. 1_MG-2023 TaxID=3062672 RepID=UPI0026E2B36C|nr:diguanylate cyclase [Motilimonas sp. 1_MG-2023]MDO6525811.1 diguanylate cyclase [Motilimonas sp. 1_MG-2023]